MREGTEGPRDQGAKGGDSAGSSFARAARTIALFTICSMSFLSAQDSGGRGEFTLVGGRVLLPGGTLTGGLAVVISDGQIQRVTDAGEAGLPGVVRLAPASVLSPGLIDVGSTIGSYEQNVETARGVDPGAGARAAVDGLHRNLPLALKAGITSAMVCPSPVNVVSGCAVTFSTAATKGELEVLRDDGPLVFALSERVLRRDRTPTSRGGARHLLREALGAARAGQGHPRLKSFVDGRIPGLIFCDGEPDLRAAFEIFDAVERHPHFVHNSDVPIDSTASFAAAAAKRKVITVVGPFDFTSEEPRLRAAGALDRAGVKVAFSSGLPVASRHSPRVTAALAVRYGMDPAAARRALTVHAAEVAGVADRTGTIAARKEADLVVFSADPLRLEARVLEVYVRGVRHVSAKVNP